MKKKKLVILKTKSRKEILERRDANVDDFENSLERDQTTRFAYLSGYIDALDWALGRFDKE